MHIFIQNKKIIVKRRKPHILQNQKVLKMHTLLIVAEVIWLVYYASINIATFIVANGSLVIERSVRQDVFALGTHVGIVLATIHGKCGTPWLAVLYGFELFRDVLNAVNIQIYTPLQAFNQNLWIAVLILAWFQVVTTFIGMCFCLVQFNGVIAIKTKVPQFNYK